MDQSIELYYTPPREKEFDDLKICAMCIWNTYDNTHGYVDEKNNKLKDLKNIKDNFMYIFAMFDINNQRLVLTLVESKTKKEVLKRLPSDYLEKYL